MMRKLKIIAIGLILGSLVGCAGVLDLLVGPADAPGAEPSQPTVVERAADAASGMPGPIGMVGGVLLAGLNLLQAYQNRRQKSSLQTYQEGLKGVVVGLDRALEQGQKVSVTKDELYAALSARLLDPLIKEFIAKVKIEDRS